MAPAHDATSRLFDKLDQIQSSQATVMADVARVQGAQKGIETAIQVVSNAIGDVNETKLESRETKTKIESMEKSIEELKQTMQSRDTKDWIEGLVKWVAGGLAAGGAIGATNTLLSRFF